MAMFSERIPWPETLPHLGALRIGADGALWPGWPERLGVEFPERPELVREWRVIHAGDGTAPPRVHRVLLPAGATLLAPDDPGRGGGHFFILLRDGMDRQGVGILRVEGGG